MTPSRDWAEAKADEIIAAFNLIPGAVQVLRRRALREAIAAALREADAAATERAAGIVQRYGTGNTLSLAKRIRAASEGKG